MLSLPGLAQYDDVAGRHGHAGEQAEDALRDQLLRVLRRLAPPGREDRLQHQVGGLQCCQVVNSVARLSTVLPGCQQCCQVVNSVAMWSTVLPDGLQCYQVVSSVARWSTVLPGGLQC